MTCWRWRVVGAIDTVILAFHRDEGVDLDAIVRRLRSVPVQIALYVDLKRLPPSMLALRKLGGVALARGGRSAIATSGFAAEGGYGIASARPCCCW
ncbi:MAG: hypothetical protein WDN04_15060 [Rhodospirillales bacterium]